MSLLELSFFYNNIAIMLHTGVGLIPFFETLSTSENFTEHRRKIIYIHQQLQRGDSLSSLLKTTGLVPIFDIPLIEAGEKSGKLVYVYQSLSKSYDQSATAQAKIKNGLYYPYFLFIASLFIPYLPDLITEKISLISYLIKSFTPLMIVLCITYFSFSLFLKSYYDLKLAQKKHNLFQKIPYLKTLSDRIALEKFCSSLEIMLDSGINFFDALKMAGHTSANYQIDLASRRILAELKNGKTIAVAFKEESVFTEDIIDSLAMGYQSGSIPYFLNKSSERLREQIRASVEGLSKTIPFIIYQAAIAYVALTILALYVSNVRALFKMF
ncbi:MAG: type II secretion system F family protein [Pseudobdellovibrio sp.]